MRLTAIVIAPRPTLSILVLFNVHSTTVRHVLWVIYWISFDPGLNEAAIGVLINRSNRCLFCQDLLRHVVVGITRFFSGFKRRLIDNLVVRRIVEARDIPAMGGGEQRQESRWLVVVPYP